MPGYWVSPDGKISTVGVDHYEYIEKHPKKFGLKPAEVRGKAVEEIWDLSLEWTPR